MDRTVRVRSLVWFATGAMLAIAATVIVMQTWRVDAAPGDADATFVPITPCRLLDTRPPDEQRFGPGEVRTLDAHGTNGECTLPNDAVGLSTNVTTLDATTFGTYLTFWRDGEPQPNASSLNPAPGQPPTPNAVAVPLSAAGRFKVFNFSGSVEVIIDVDGYYTRSSLQELAGRVAANESDIQRLDDREAFAATGTSVGNSVSSVSWSEIEKVTITASAAGHVTVTGDGEISEISNGELITCGISDSATVPPRFPFWQAPFGGGNTIFSVTEVFPIDAGATATYSLMCLNTSGGTSTIFESAVSAIFTPAR